MHVLRKLKTRRRPRKALYNVEEPQVLELTDVDHVGEVVAVANPSTQPHIDDGFYQYQPLERTNRQIRLLRFYRDNLSPSSKIECELRHVILTPKHSRRWTYSALSYTWGNPHPEQEICINGRRMVIGPNLYRFCDQFRRNEHFQDSKWTGWMWIDQICIDQRNVLERNHQVELMTAIYGSANDTIIWIHDDQTRHGTEVIPIAAVVEYLVQRLLPLGKYYIQQLMENDNARNASFGCLSRFLRHTYFSRLWIIQEVLLSSRIWILVEGGMHVPWPILYHIHAILQDLALANVKWFQKLWPVEQTANILFTLRAYRENSDREQLNPTERQHQQLTLLDCVQNFSGLGCSDPRDKLFGLMGLVLEGQQLDVDYSKSVQDLLLDVLRAHMKSDTNSVSHDVLRNLGVEMRLSESDQRGWNAFVNSIWVEDKVWYGHSGDAKSFEAIKIIDMEYTYRTEWFDGPGTGIWSYGDGHERSDFFCVPRTTEQIDMLAAFESWRTNLGSSVQLNALVSNLDVKNFQRRSSAMANAENSIRYMSSFAHIRIGIPLYRKD